MEDFISASCVVDPCPETGKAARRDRRNGRQTDAAAAAQRRTTISPKGLIAWIIWKYKEKRS